MREEKKEFYVSQNDVAYYTSKFGADKMLVRQFEKVLIPNDEFCDMSFKDKMSCCNSVINSLVMSIERLDDLIRETELSCIIDLSVSSLSHGDVFDNDIKIVNEYNQSFSSIQHIGHVSENRTMDATFMKKAIISGFYEYKNVYSEALELIQKQMCNF